MHGSAVARGLGRRQHTHQYGNVRDEMSQGDLEEMSIYFGRVSRRDGLVNGGTGRRMAGSIVNFVLWGGSCEVYWCEVFGVKQQASIKLRKTAFVGGKKGTEKECLVLDLPQCRLQ